MKYFKKFFSSQNCSNTKENINPIFSLNEVFTPGIAAKSNFIDRPHLIQQIDDAFETPGRQIIVYGNSGSGKTTLIQHYMKTNKKEYISYNCTVDTTFESLLKHAFDKLNDVYTSEESIKSSDFRESEIGADIKVVSHKNRSSSTCESIKKSQRILPPELTIQNLSRCLGKSNKYWIIEDFHKVEINERKKIAQSLKVFVDLANDYPNSKIIAIGAVNTSQQLIDLDTDIEYRVAKIHIPFMNEKEIREILTNGQILLNFEFSSEIMNGIIQKSKPFAIVCHQLAKIVCSKAGIIHSCSIKQHVYDRKYLDEAINRWLNENSEQYNLKYLKAKKNVKSPAFNIDIILLSFLNLDKDELSISEIYNYYNKNEKDKGKRKRNINNNIFNEELHKLTSEASGSIIILNPVNKKFKLYTPFFKAFLIMKFNEIEDNHEIEVFKGMNLKKDTLVLELDIKDDKTFKLIEAWSALFLNEDGCNYIDNI